MNIVLKTLQPKTFCPTHACTTSPALRDAYPLRRTRGLWAKSDGVAHSKGSTPRCARQDSPTAPQRPGSRRRAWHDARPRDNGARWSGANRRYGTEVGFDRGNPAPRLAVTESGR